MSVEFSFKIRQCVENEDGQLLERTTRECAHGGRATRAGGAVEALQKEIKRAPVWYDRGPIIGETMRMHEELMRRA